MDDGQPTASLDGAAPPATFIGRLVSAEIEVVPRLRFGPIDPEQLVPCNETASALSIGRNAVVATSELRQVTSTAPPTTALEAGDECSPGRARSALWGRFSPARGSVRRRRDVLAGRRGRPRGDDVPRHWGSRSTTEARLSVARPGRRESAYDSEQTIVRAATRPRSVLRRRSGDRRSAR
jgi:hypothetical protein